MIPLLDVPAFWAFWRSRAARLRGSLFLLLGSPAARAIRSSRTAWLPRSLVFYGSLATRRPDFSTGQPGNPGCRVYWACWILGNLVSLLERLAHLAVRFPELPGVCGNFASPSLAVWSVGQCGLHGLPACRSVWVRPLPSSPVPFDSLVTRVGWSGGAAWLPGGF